MNFKVIFWGPFCKPLYCDGGILIKDYDLLIWLHGFYFLRVHTKKFLYYFIKPL